MRKGHYEFVFFDDSSLTFEMLFKTKQIYEEEIPRYLAAHGIKEARFCDEEHLSGVAKLKNEE